jgi:hypothetical protein
MLQSKPTSPIYNILTKIDYLLLIIIHLTYLQ